MGDAFGPRFRASRRATLRCLALTASIAIAGCAPLEPDRDASHEGRKVVRLVDGYGYAGVFRFCDDVGRAVYFNDTAHGGGLVVIPDAPECRTVVDYSKPGMGPMPPRLDQ